MPDPWKANQSRMGGSWSKITTPQPSPAMPLMMGEPLCLMTTVSGASAKPS